MGEIRKPFQGVLNIIRFNWHFYVGVILLLFSINFTAIYFGELNQYWIRVFSVIMLLVVFISLSVSYYVYDLSGLYTLEWISNLTDKKKYKIVNINAGFDETSILINKKFIDSELTVLDFYDPSKHTEVSIKRARKVYPSHPNTINVQTDSIEMEDNSQDKILVILSAHEIRDRDERITFFKELRRILKPNGEIIITEHLRDVANFCAYTIGFFHFYSKKEWLKIFSSSGLSCVKEIKITPFITTFILQRNGNTD